MMMRNVVRSVELLGFVVLAIMIGCEDGATLLQRSCAGEAIPNCLPYEYSVVENASIDPSGLEIGNPTQEAMITVELATCGADAPLPHRVRLIARTTNSMGLGDAGQESLMDLDTEVADDGENGDAVAKDGTIQVTVPNPFFSLEDNLANSEIAVRFEPRAPINCTGEECIGGTCVGQTLEIGYQTGGEFDP